MYTIDYFSKAKVLTSAIP